MSGQGGVWGGALRCEGRWGGRVASVQAKQSFFLRAAGRGGSARGPVPCAPCAANRATAPRTTDLVFMFSLKKFLRAENQRTDTRDRG